MEKWVVTAKKADFQGIGRKYGIDPVIARIIRNRDITGDEAASNGIQKMTLKMAVPEGIKCIIKSVEDVTTILDDPRSESMRLMVLVPMVKDAVTLCKRYKNIEMVNIGNAGKMTSGEKKILSKEVMLTADELEALKELTELYPDTFFQGTPAMEKKMASAILKGC